MSPAARVSVLTALRGKSLYETWGHTAIRVWDPASDIDQVYNYGTFDFDQPGFYLKFMRGRLDYRLASTSFERFDRAYRYLERPLIEQTLDLDPADRQALFDFLVWNDAPGRREYRYDFFFDNCSTRPRDVVERVLGDRLTWNAPDPERSFRELLDPGLAHRPWADFGIDVALGRGTDRTATPREAMFLPFRLRDALDRAQLLTGTGARPLVSRTDTLFWIEGAGEERTAVSWPLILTTLLFLAGLALTLASRGNAVRKVQPLFDALVFLLVGFAGLVFTLLWVATDHASTESNWQLLWAWPTHLALVSTALRTSGRTVVRLYLGLAGTAAAVAVVGWFWFIPQEMHPAALPLAALTAVRCLDLGRGRTAGSTPARPSGAASSTSLG